MKFVFLVLMLFSGQRALAQTIEADAQVETSIDDSLKIDQLIQLDRGETLQKGTNGKKSLKEKEQPQEESTCGEIYQELKNSDCGKTVFKYLGGSNIRVGGSLNISSLEIISNGGLMAGLVGLWSPAPYYSLSLAPRYFGQTSIGYDFALDYTTASTVEQSIKRGEESKRVNLHTLSVLSMAAVTPSLFYGIGVRDKDPKTYFKVGLGVGVGWSGIRGLAYFTEENSLDNIVCYNTSSSYLEGTSTITDIKRDCELKNFEASSIGGSVRLFLDWRWNWVYGSFEVISIRVSSSQYELNPTEAKVKVAYIADL